MPLFVFFLAFGVLGFPAYLMAAEGEEAAKVALFLIALFGLIFIVTHIIRTKAYEEMLGRVFLAIALVVGCAIPVVNFICIPLLLIFTIINIAEAFQSLRDLRVHAAFSVALVGSLVFIRHIGDFPSLLYMVVAAAFSWRVARKPLYNALLEISVMALSVPLMALIIVSIVSGLRSMFSVTTSSLTSNMRVAQNVSAHVRAGVNVEAYTREVTKAVVTPVTSVAVGAGGVIIGGAAVVAKGVDIKGDAVAAELSGAGSDNESPQKSGGRLGWVVVLVLLVAGVVWIGGGGQPDEQPGVGEVKLVQAESAGAEPALPAVAGAPAVTEMPVAAEQEVAGSEESQLQQDAESAPEPEAVAEPQQVVIRPSFDCSKASSLVEGLVCSDQELAALDVQLSAAYKAALFSASDKGELKRSQRAWLSDALSPCQDVSCARAAYKERVFWLQAHR